MPGALYAFQKKENRPMCSHFGVVGHIIDRCYKLHGYPVGWKKGKPIHGKPASSSAVTAAVSSSDKTSGGNLDSLVGNLSKDQIQEFIAYFSSQLQPSSSVNNINTSSVASTSQSPSGISFSPSTFSFIGILTVSACVTSVKTWIIDSGATHHATHDKSLFTELDTSVNHHVNLPTGQTVQIGGAGTVVLNTTITLKNVIYIPAFRLNMLSISALTTDLGSRIIFDHECCLI